MAKTRKPGGGRKPQGSISGLRSVMSVRMTDAMRKALVKAAKENRRSTTQELLGRLEWSFKEDRKNKRDPASRALGFLIAELAEYVHSGTADWRSDPHLFKAFKIAVPKLLDGLPMPAGKITPPPSPEAIAEHAVEQTLAAFFAPSKIYKDWALLREQLGASLDQPDVLNKWLRYQENIFYGNDNARRDLNIKPDKGRKS